MAEALQPGTFRSIVAVEPILHSPMMMELMLSNPLDANPLSAGARRRRADFQSRYARHRRGRTVNGAHENKDGRGVRACRQGGGGNLFCLALPLQAVGPSCAGRLRGPFRSYKQSLRAWTGLRTHPSLPCRSHVRRTACASGPTPNWPPFLARAASRSSARRLLKRYGRAHHHTNATKRTPPSERHHTNATKRTPVSGLAHCTCGPVLGSLVAPAEFVRRVVPEPDLRPPANAARADPDGPRRDVHHLVWPPIIDAGPPKHVFTI